MNTRDDGMDRQESAVRGRPKQLTVALDYGYVPGTKDER